jgi:hypothetical protein
MGKRNGASSGRKPRPAQALPIPAIASTKTPFEREEVTKRCGEISELVFALAAARRHFGVSRPYGDSERYDLILDPSHIAPAIPTRADRQRTNWISQLVVPTRPRLIRVQVKGTTQLLNGLYRVNTGRRLNGRAVPYTLAEIDFIAAYVIPEDSWFILPLAHILGQTAVLLSPKRRRKPSLYDPYREAWHLLHQPDTLEFA